MTNDLTIKQLREALQKKASQSLSDKEDKKPLITVHNQEFYPLSSTQKRLYFNHHFSENSTAYNLSAKIKISGIINPELLQKSFQDLVARHVILRTSFEEVDGEVIQRVHEHIDFSLTTCKNPHETLSEAFNQFVQVFDLSYPPLIRAQLFQVDTTENYLLIDLPHIVADGKSMSILLKDIINLYLKKQLPPLEIQFKDFACWQQDQLLQKRFQSAKNYWLNHLKNESSLLTFQKKASLKKNLTQNGAAFSFSFEAKNSQIIKNFCSKQRITPYILFMSIYQIFLSKICNVKEVIVGSSSEGRMDTSLQNICGPFINTLPIKGILSPQKSFSQFLDEMKETCLNAIQNQYFPLEEILNQLNYSSSSTEFIQTFFDLHQDHILKTDFLGIEFEILPIVSSDSKFPLSLEIIDKGDNFQCHFEFDYSYFSNADIQTFSEAFKSLSLSVIENSDQLIMNLPLISNQKLAGAQPDSKIDHKDKLFLDYFREHVQKTPNKIAACLNHSQLSYETLDMMSSHVARHLLFEGIREDDCIAFYFERSLEFLIGMLAAFKIGAAYIPLDLSAPRQRILNLLQESRAKVVLTKQKHSWINSSQFVISALLQNEIPEIQFEYPLDPCNIAYTIFTSGSTGKPKGVAIEHRGMVNHLIAKVKDFNLTHCDIIAQTSSQTFDVSVWQFLAPLMVGGKVVIIPDEDAWSVWPLVQSLNQFMCSIYETVPSHMSILIKELTQEKSAPSLPHLRCLILNGEPFYSHLFSSWKNLYPTLQLANVYGPTECSDDVTHFLIPPDFQTLDLTIPIGEIIGNLKGFVLDKFLCNTLPNMKGELYIEGIGLARGYLYQPALTAETFIPSPFSQSQRMYKTGDLVSYSEHRVLQHYGRIDTQVKINGRRLEIGEVEFAINQFPELSQAVVIQNGKENRQHLTCYVSFKDKVNLDSLISYLEDNVPSYMIPLRQNIFVIDTFPLLPSGKVDKNQLKKINTNTKQQIDKKLQKARGPIEISLHTIWEDILKRREIDVRDNFFQIGGHSLMATQLMGRILKDFGIKIPIQTIYQNPTISQLAQSINEKKLQAPNESHVSLPQIVPDLEKRNEPFPMTEIQQAYWLGRKGIFSLGDVSVHVYAEYECSDLNLYQLEQAWNQLINRHDALRIVFREDGSQCILAPPSYYKIDCLDLTTASPEKIESTQSEYRAKYSHEIFPSDVWPLFAIRAIRTPHAIRLYLSFDALIMDGWSVDILFNEWIQLYKNPEIKLLPLELSFRDYVLSAETFKQHPQYIEDKNYWLSRLESFPGAPDLPIVKQPDQIKNQHFSRCIKRIPKIEWEKAQALIQKKMMSPTGFLAFLFSEILYLYSNSSQFSINLTLFDRPPLHDQINDIVGDFTSLTLLEIDREFQSTFESRAKKMQSQLWGDLDHHLFGGIEFIRELAKASQGNGSREFPVVLTSVLGLDDQQNVDLEKFFGQEIFSITQTPQVWLDFKAYEVSGDLIIEWDYVTELFEPGFIESMHTSYIQLFNTLCHTESAWEVSTLSSISEKQIIVKEAYNATEKTYPDCLMFSKIDAFDSSLKRTPAIIDQDLQLSYESLKTLTDKLASQLHSLGLCKNSLVAIVMNKGWEQVVATIAIQKAGGAYLPIDANLPKERIEQLLDLGNTSIAITQNHLQNSLLSMSYINDNGCSVLTIDKITSPTLSSASQDYNISDLAYVIFTSGSTGTPKGVMIDHQAAMNTIFAINDQFKVTSQDKVLALSNLNFDLSVYDIFGLLSAGGSLVIPDESKIKDPSYWADLIIKHTITIWNTVPMFMQMFIEYLYEAPEAVTNSLRDTLRIILLSGDWIPLDLPKKISLFFPNARIISLGGATEASIWSIYYEIDPIQNYSNSIPYGFPLPNQTFYVLDKEGSDKPDFVPGELYIGGKGLAKGYWKDSEKTQAAFIEHPRLGRIYKTGDYGVFKPKIGIEFLGRKDTQVKVRGHRIELGEIASKLKNHPDIDQALVITIGSNRYNQQLCGCIIPIADSSPQDKLENIITDENQRSQFTLEQKGTEQISSQDVSIELKRSDQSPAKFLRKSHRHFDGSKIQKDSLLNWLNQSLRSPQIKGNNQILDNDLLSTLFQSIAILDVDSALPKFPYPSAGSLYPVQVFFSSNGKDSLIPEGVYYYHPKAHQLIQVSKEYSDKSSSLSFIEKKEAIAPLYGHYSTHLSQIEAGCMTSFILRFFERQKISATLDFSGNSLLRMELTTSSNQEVHYPEVYIFIKQDAVESFKGGWYHYNLSSQSLMESGDHTPFEVLPSLEDTYSILTSASGGIFFVQKESDNAFHKHILTFAGYFSQQLMDFGIKHRIGGCPLVRLDSKGISSINQVCQGGKAIHYFLFGPTTVEQMTDISTSNYPTNAFVHTLQKFLRSKLPEYMVPETFLQLEKFPLTANGKVDLKILKKQFESQGSKKRNITPPSTMTEKKLFKIWKDVLSRETIGIDDNFFEIGGNSLLMTKMALLVRKKFNVDIPLNVFFNSTTIKSLSDGIENQQTSTNPELEEHIKDISICDHLQFNLTDKPLGGRTLLTGATGFLGSHILSDLLSNSENLIYCLVRAKSEREARQRIEESQKKFRLGNTTDNPRIIPILGDLSKPHLGLSKEDLQMIKSNINSIIHNGAHVHHIFDYNKLRKTNVLSTSSLLEIASKHNIPFVYVSSLLSIVDQDNQGHLKEEFPSGETQGLYGGYQKTKWVNEMILKKAFEKGLDVRIFRPNTICGQSSTGISAYASDHFLRLVKGCIQMGVAPIWNAAIDLLPVDYVSESIVQISKQAAVPSPIFNLTSRSIFTWTQLIEWLIERGYRIKLIPAEIWRTKHLSNIDSQNALFPFLAIYLSSQADHETTSSDSPLMVANHKSYLDQIQKMGLREPSVTPAYLNNIFTYLEKQNFLQLS